MNDAATATLLGGNRFLAGRRGQRTAGVLLLLLLIVGLGWRMAGAEPASAAPAGPAYGITDLGTFPGGNTSAATAINAAGQVVGFASTAQGLPHAFLWDSTGMHDLGTLGGQTSTATAINRSGQIVGTAGSFGKVPTTHAFLYDRAGMHDLGTLGGATSEARGISDAGVIVGAATMDKTRIRHAFHAAGPGLGDLGTLGGQTSESMAINAGGQMVGSSLTAAGAEHAFRYDSTGWHDLGTLPGGRSSAASAISTPGQIAGYAATASGATHAFFEAGAGLRDLGTLGGLISAATAINASGAVVGYSYLAGGPQTHAFLWQPSAGMVDLNALLPAGSGWTLTYAAGINDGGQIVGTGIVGGHAHAFLLTPSTRSPVGP